MNDILHAVVDYKLNLNMKMLKNSLAGGIEKKNALSAKIRTIKSEIF
jgi:NRPS condensation-like uncharacterized protein